MLISDLRTAHLTNPLGYRIDRPCFSWLTHTACKAFQVQISGSPDFVNLLFDSGMKSDIYSHAYTADFRPLAKSRYFWRVLARTEDDEEVQSETAYFETGMMETPWQARWITAPFSQKVHPYFHKNFKIAEAVRSARIYVTALGLYELELNGRRVGNEYLTPFCNDYREWIQVQTYDITDQLHAGDNAITALLGNGWYKGRFGFVGEMDELVGDHFALLAEIDITYEDSSSEIIAGDASWFTLPSPIQSSSIYDGEVFDQTREIAGRGTVAVDLSSADQAVIYDHPYDLLEDRLSPPLIIKETRAAAKLIRTPAGENVLDFGQVLTGWVRFKADEAKGQEIHFQFGELLQNGNFYRDNLRSAKAEYTYISDGLAKQIRPHFTFYGFRFVKLSGISDINPADFTAEVIYSDLEETGQIETSNAKVNQLFRNALWGQKGNFLDVPTDCPQRDERMGWTGDAQVFAATASYNMYTPAFFHKYLYDMKLEQRRLGGAVPHVVPDFLNITKQKIGEEGSDFASAAWADAATVIPWAVYVQYGNPDLLAEHYENMKLWVDYVRGIDEQHCEGRRLWTHGFHFGDWLALDNPDNLKDPNHNSSFGGTDPFYIASAYYFYSTTLTAKAARVLGKIDDAIAYETLAAEIKAAIQKEYFTSDGRCLIQTQTAQVLALWFEFCPEGKDDLVVADLKRLLDENNGHLSTGFVGTAYLCLTLSKVGLHDYAVSLLLNEAYPGWLYEVNMGATTVWERWNSVLENGLVSDTGMNSMNHYAYGAIAEWMYRCLCGINPVEDAPGFRQAIIHPQPDRRLGFAKASYKSAYGLYESSWRYDNQTIIYQLRIPHGATARFKAAIDGNFTVNGEDVRHEFGDTDLELTPGTYKIVANV